MHHATAAQPEAESRQRRQQQQQRQEQQQQWQQPVMQHQVPSLDTAGQAEFGEAGAENMSPNVSPSKAQDAAEHAQKSMTKAALKQQQQDQQHTVTAMHDIATAVAPTLNHPVTAVSSTHISNFASHRAATSAMPMLRNSDAAETSASVSSGQIDCQSSGAAEHMPGSSTGMPKTETGACDKLADIYAFLDDVEAQAEQEAASLLSQAPSHGHAVYSNGSYDRHAAQQDRRHGARRGAYQLPQEASQQQQRQQQQGQQQQQQQQLQGLKAEAQGRAQSADLGRAASPAVPGSVSVVAEGGTPPEVFKSPGELPVLLLLCCYC